MDKEFEKGEVSSKTLVKAALFILFLVAVVWGIGRRIEQEDETHGIKPNIIKNAPLQKEGRDILSDIPLNEKISIARSGKKKTAEGELIEQSIIFYSKEAVSENKKFYGSWAETNDWQKTENYNGGENSLFLTKGNGALDVSFEEGQNGAAKITLIYRSI